MPLLEADEKIFAIRRRHPITFFFAVAPLLFFFLALIFGAIFGISRMPEEDAVLTSAILLLAVVFTHILWLALFMISADYFLNVFIVTNQRVIMLTQKGLFAKTISECALSKVQDVSADISGFLPTLLKYGNLAVRTAAEEEDFIFKQIADPFDFADKISEMIKESVKNEQ